MPRYVTLPPNLCSEKTLQGKSIYFRDYCSRYRPNAPKHKPVNPHTAMITENSVNNLIMTDHYSTLPLGYSHKDYSETIEQIKNDTKSMKIQDGSKTEDEIEDIKEKFPGTKEKIEKAWIDEVDTNKRNRGYIYGLAGKKIELQKKNPNKDIKDSLPGLDRWLHTANEYEKQVVHKFITNVSESQESRPDRAMSRASCTKSATPIPTHKVRFHSAPKSAPPLLYRQSIPKSNVRLITETLPRSADIWTPPEGEEKKGRKSVSSLSSSVEESPRYNGTEAKDVSTQLPHSTKEKPTSPQYDMQQAKDENRVHRRSLTSPTRASQHICQNCEACKKKLMKRMLKELSSTDPKTYESLLRERRRHPRTMSTHVYRPIINDDYVHSGTSFQNVNRFRKGYFIIHPDFVSESNPCPIEHGDTNVRVH